VIGVVEGPVRVAVRVRVAVAVVAVMEEVVVVARGSLETGLELRVDMVLRPNPTARVVRLVVFSVWLRVHCCIACWCVCVSLLPAPTLTPALTPTSSHTPTPAGSSLRSRLGLSRDF
jgi:hypothetical protein